MVDFNSLLEKSADEVPVPKSAPPGTYKCRVGEYETGTSSKKGTPFLQFSFHPLEPMEDVDTESLADVDLESMTFRDEFYLTEKALYRLVRFAQSCGVKTEGRQLNEIVEELSGAEVLVSVSQDPSDREGDDRFFNNVSGYAAVD